MVRRERGEGRAGGWGGCERNEEAGRHVWSYGSCKVLLQLTLVGPLLGSGLLLQENISDPGFQHFLTTRFLPLAIFGPFHHLPFFAHLDLPICFVKRTACDGDVLNEVLEDGTSR
jgi:hypothetical protein